MLSSVCWGLCLGNIMYDKRRSAEMSIATQILVHVIHEIENLLLP